jgi:hypothetical protein
MIDRKSPWFNRLEQFPRGKKGKAMRLVKYAFVVLAAAAGALAASAAKAGPNAPLCLMLENNYNQCIVQAQRQGGYGGDYDRGWGGGPGGGWDDDRGYYRRQRGQGASQAKQAECARWLVSIQQNNCVR